MYLPVLFLSWIVIAERSSNFKVAPSHLEGLRKANCDAFPHISQHAENDSLKIKFPFFIPDTQPGPRAMHHLVYQPDSESILLVNGTWPGIQTSYTQVWSWNGKVWRPFPQSGPQPRYADAAVYDTRRNLLVLYGGRVGPKEKIQGDTWEYDDSKWQQMADSSAGPRDHHSMVYDPDKERCIMFGGGTYPRTAVWLTDTWVWNGKNWKNIASEGPKGRVTAMAYDIKRNETVLFGGVGDSPAPGQPQEVFNDTWVFKSNSWLLKKPSIAPKPRSRHAMVYDESEKIVLLYGGATAEQGYLGDMWKWDGINWTEIKLDGLTPGKRCLHAMVYNPSAKKTYLYGGNREGKVLGDLWEWDGRNWSKVHE